MDLDQLRALLAVVEHRSLAAASEALGLSRPTVRARVDSLQEQLGVSLMVRSNQGVVITDSGHRFAERARELLKEANDLEAFGRSDTQEVIGELRVMGTTGAAPPMLGMLIATTLRARHPQLRLHVDTCADPVAQAGPEVDIVMHFGDAPSDGPYRTTALARFPVHLIASRSYLDRRGRPQTVEDLDDHDLVALLPPAGDGENWPLLEGGTFRITPSFTHREIMAARVFAAAGLGIALLPDAKVGMGAVPGEDFEVVLGDRVGREGVVRVLIAERQAHTARSRAVVALIREVMGGDLDLPKEFVLD